MWWRMRFSNDADGAGVMIASADTFPASLPVVEFAAPILMFNAFVAGPAPPPEEKATVFNVSPLTEHDAEPPA